MRKIVFLLTALCLSMSAWSQDGLVYWSQADGYKFDFDLDGTVDFSLPTQTTDKAIYRAQNEMYMSGDRKKREKICRSKGCACQRH